MASNAFQTFPSARRPALSLAGALLFLSLWSGGSPARCDEPSTAGDIPGDAKIAVVGTQACSLCEFGVGTECCLGILAGDMKFVVEGPACDKLFDNRHSGDKTYVVGRLFIKNKTLYLEGKTLDLPEEVPPPATATGTLQAEGQELVLQSGQTIIRLVGPQQKQARQWIGRRVRIAGRLTLSDQGQVTLEATDIGRAEDQT